VSVLTVDTYTVGLCNNNNVSGYGDENGHIILPCSSNEIVRVGDVDVVVDVTGDDDDADNDEVDDDDDDDDDEEKDDDSVASLIIFELSKVGEQPSRRNNFTITLSLY
jgi:phosphopantothenoylcysteine synthetase/decarboxylase